MNSATSLLSNGATGTGESWSLQLGKNTVISTLFFLIFIFYKTKKLYLNSGKLRDRPYKDCLMGRLNTTFRAPKFVNFTFEKNKIQWHEMDFANSNIMFKLYSIFALKKISALIFVVFYNSKEVN